MQANHDPEDLRGDPLHDREVSAVLHEAVPILESHGIPYVVIGGIATSRWGKPAAIKDLDFFVRKEGAERAIDLFAESGYKVQKTYPQWLYKAFKGPVTIDLIFAVKERILLDDEILARSVSHIVDGCKLQLVGPEDLIISLAVSDAPDTSYWHNALSVIQRTSDLDWDYLSGRAAVAPHRMLGLFLYARSDGLMVPGDVTEELWEQVRIAVGDVQHEPEIARSA